MRLTETIENYYYAFRYLRTREILGRVRYLPLNLLYRALPRLRITRAIQRACDLAAGKVIPSRTFQYPEAAGNLFGGYEAERRFRFLEETMELL